MDARKPYARLVVSGAVSAALYLGLYVYEPEIMQALTRTDGFYPLLPIGLALLFSFAHGAFTGYFWEILGVRPRKRA